MIRRLSSLEALLSACPDDSPEGCRIVGTALAYGLNTSFFDVWRCDSSDGAPAAVISRLDGAGTLALSSGREVLSEGAAQELAEFIRVVGFSSLLADASMTGRLDLSPAECGVAMLRSPEQTLCVGEIGQALEERGITAEFDPSPRLLYPLLALAGGAIDLPPFDGWYVDLSHRMRRDLAHAVLLQKDGESLACAISSGETAHAALLTGVAAAPWVRGEGLGSAAVRLLCSRLKPDRRLCLLRAPQEHEEFYRRLGFAGTRTLDFVRDFS